jgi:thiamine-monophosphate kinase
MPPKPSRDRRDGLPTDEDAALERIGSSLTSVLGGPPDGELWLGDDAAVVVWPGGPLLLSTDAVVGGVHADLELVSPEDFGWKAVTAAVSDIGAMGGRPRHVLVTLAGPPGTDLDALTRGAGAAARAWGCVVVGGDVTGAPELVVSVAVTGGLPDDPDHPATARPAVTRSGARPGDRLFVTGPLGASAAGLRLLRLDPADGADQQAAGLRRAHRRPTARIGEGVAARWAGATAMMDVTDGLALDLHRLARSSGVGFDLEVVPVAAGATADEALGGGEDYELIVATGDPDGLVEAYAAAGLRPPSAIGWCRADPLRRTLAGQPLAATGYQHRFS